MVLEACITVMAPMQWGFLFQLVTLVLKHAPNVMACMQFKSFPQMVLTVILACRGMHATCIICAAEYWSSEATF